MRKVLVIHGIVWIVWKTSETVRWRSVALEHFTVKGEEFLETNFINRIARAPASATPIGRAAGLRPGQKQKPERSNRRP
jgi:hypothetical protein